MARRDVELIIRAQDEASAAIKAVTDAIAALGQEQKEAAASVGGFDTRMQALSQAFNNLRQQIGGFQELARAKQTFDAAAKAVDNLASKEARLGQELDELRVKQAASADAARNALASEQKFAQAIDETRAKIGATANEIKKLEAQKNKYAKAAAKAGTATDKFNREIAETEAELTGLRGKLEAARGSLQQQEAAYQKLTAAQQKLASAGIGTLVRGVQAQQKAVNDSIAAWRAATEAATKYGAATAVIGPKTAQVTAEFAKLRATAQQTKQEMLLNGQAMSQMRANLTAVRAGTQTLTAAQQNFAATQSRLAGSINQVRTASAATVANIQKLTQQTQRAATVQTQLGTAARGTATALNQQAFAASKAAAEMNSLGIGTRQAMSFTQRLRGELIAVTRNVLGFYAAWRGTVNVINAVRDIENAMVRLNSIFADKGGAPAATAQFDKLRRMSDQLGISLGVLSQQFSLFAASTVGTSIDMNETNEIFRAVAVSARVMGLSLDDVQGVFKALGQIASKGVVQMEELRGQIGDRMPGALQIMAEGLGITVEQLMDLTKQGKVTSDALIGFADRLLQRYEKDLPAAMQSVAGVLGRLGATAFQALQKIGQSGFVAEFKSFIVDITKFLQSAEGDTFFKNLGNAMAAVVKVLRVLVEYMRELIVVTGFLLGMKVGNFLAGALAVVTQNVIRMVDNTRTAIVLMRSFGSTMTTTAIAATVLRGELAALMGTTGIGLLVAGIGAGIAAWIQHVDAATRAFNTADGIIDNIKNTVDAVTVATSKWANEIDGVTRSQLKQSIIETTKAIDDQTEALIAASKATLAAVPIWQRLDAEYAKGVESINAMIDAYAHGNLKLADFIEQLSKLGTETGSDVLREKINEIIVTLQELETNEDKLGFLQTAFANLDKGPEEFTAAMRQYMDSIGEATVVTEGLTDAATGYGDAIEDAGEKADRALDKNKDTAEELSNIWRKTAEGWRRLTKEEVGAGKNVINVQDQLRQQAKNTKEFEENMRKAREETAGAADEAGRLAESTERAATASEGTGVAGAAGDGGAGVQGVREQTQAQQDLRTELRGTIQDQEDINARIATNAEASRQWDENVRAANETQRRQLDEMAAEWQRMHEQNAAAGTPFKTWNEDMQQYHDGIDQLVAADPFGTMAQQTQAATEAANEAGVSVEEIIQRANDLQTLFSTIDPGGFLTNAQKQAIALGEPLSAAQQQLLDLKVIAETPPGTDALIPATVHSLDGLTEKLNVVSPQLLDLAKQQFMEGVPEDVDATSRALGDVNQEINAIPDVQGAFDGLGDGAQSESQQAANAVSSMVDSVAADLARLRRAIAEVRQEAANAASATASAATASVGGGGGEEAATAGVGATAMTAAAPMTFGGGMALAPRGTAGLRLVPTREMFTGGAGGGKQRQLRPINLTLPGGETIPVLAPETAATALVRYARKKQASSAGRAPGWVV